MEYNIKPDKLDKLLSDPCTPYWIQEVSQLLQRKDPVDAINGLEALAQAMDTDLKAYFRKMKGDFDNG